MHHINYLFLCFILIVSFSSFRKIIFLTKQYCYIPLTASQSIRISEKKCEIKKEEEKNETTL